MRRRRTAAHASRFTSMRHNRSTAADQARGRAYHGHARQSSIEAILQWLGSLRDGLGSLRDAFIVLGGSIFALGFVAWGVVSVVNLEFGLSGADYAQIFVAGIGPFLGFSLACLTMFKAPKLIRDFDSNINNKYRPHIGESIILVSLAGLFLMSIFSETLKGRGISYIVALVFLMFIWLTFIEFFLMLGDNVKEDTETTHPKIEKYRSFFHENLRDSFLQVSIVISLMVALLIILFSLVLIEYLPQGLGGIKPRCVVFDLLKEGISEKTAAALSGNEEVAIANQKIIRTDKLDLLFSGTSEYIIKHEDKTYQISKNFVSIVSQCD